MRTSTTAVSALLALALPVASASAQPRGTVGSVSVAPAGAKAGAQISVTVTGTNPCGAVNIDYGDGTAITYAITGLPVTQTHAYDNGGSFAITAKGEGNCDGEVTTRISVSGPPAPRRSSGQITSLAFDPSPARAREPVTLSVAGNGSCAFNVSFGDGNAQDVSGALPQRVSHTYTLADTYTVIVRPSAPCAGKFTERLQVVAATVPQGLTGIDVAPGTATINSRVFVTLTGTGQCRVSVSFGDGEVQTYNLRLPQRVAHAWKDRGEYEIEAWTEDDCPGYVHGQVEIR